MAGKFVVTLTLMSTIGYVAVADDAMIVPGRPSIGGPSPVIETIVVSTDIGPAPVLEYTSCGEGYMENSEEYHNKNGTCREKTWFDYADKEWGFKCWEGSFSDLGEDGETVEMGMVTLPDGRRATCDPIGKYKKVDGVYVLDEAEGEAYPCCSRRGWCGNTADHCCDGCADYRFQFDGVKAKIVG